MNRYTVILCAILALSGCAASSPDANVIPLVQIPDMQTGAFGTLPSLADINGELAVLYSTKEGRVALKIGNQPKQIMDATARVQKGGSFFKLWPSEKTLYAGWWSHQSGKNVYLTSSSDGGNTFVPVSMVNDANDVLPPFTLTRGPQGVLGMTYQDERAPKFQAYFNRSIDNGLSWQRPDQRLDIPPAGGRSSDVHEPQTVESGTSWVSAWTDNMQVDGKMAYRIVSRRTEDAGLTWSQPVVLHSTDHHISSLLVRSSGNQLVLAADELNKGIFAFASSDSGRSWQGTGVLPATSGLSNSGITMVIAEGRAHLVWMEQRNEEKLRISAASLSIGKPAWEGSVKRLDAKPQDNTKSLSPVILATAKGALITAWVDYRDIRPNIYLATSYDRGVSWSAPQALLKPGEVSAGWPQLTSVNGKTVIAYELYPTERTIDGTFNTRILPVDDGAKVMTSISSFTQPSDAEKAARLTKRIDTLWAHRVAANYDSAYDMFDFAYKAATPKKAYIDNAGVIIYLGYATDDVKISGNEANVNMKLKYEVKPMILPTTGQLISVPPVDVESPTRWVWVGNDWYLVYTPSFDPPMLSY